jgi:hypothetical protein
VFAGTSIEAICHLQNVLYVMSGQKNSRKLTKLPYQTKESGGIRPQKKELKINLLPREQGYQTKPL